MLDACRTRAERDGFADRCEFHAGLVETLPEAEAFEGATCFLVSQFRLDAVAPHAFFSEIAKPMLPARTFDRSDLAWVTAAADSVSGARSDGEARVQNIKTLWEST